MLFDVSVWIIRVVTVAFFIGLTGCALAVVFSWISIFGSVFKRGE
jgi:hypothetical protein